MPRQEQEKEEIDHERLFKARHMLLKRWQQAKNVREKEKQRPWAEVPWAKKRACGMIRASFQRRWMPVTPNMAPP